MGKEYRPHWFVTVGLDGVFDDFWKFNLDKLLAFHSNAIEDASQELGKLGYDIELPRDRPPELGEIIECANRALAFLKRQHEKIALEAEPSVLTLCAIALTYEFMRKRPKKVILGGPEDYENWLGGMLSASFIAGFNAAWLKTARGGVLKAADNHYRQMEPLAQSRRGPKPKTDAMREMAKTLANENPEYSKTRITEKVAKKFGKNTSSLARTLAPTFQEMGFKSKKS